MRTWRVVVMVSNTIRTFNEARPMTSVSVSCELNPPRQTLTVKYRVTVIFTGQTFLSSSIWQESQDILLVLLVSIVYKIEVNIYKWKMKVLNMMFAIDSYYWYVIRSTVPSSSATAIREQYVVKNLLVNKMFIPSRPPISSSGTNVSTIDLHVILRYSSNIFVTKML